jgi:hypothetical protein
VQKIMAQGQEDALTVHRHRTRSVSLTRGQAGENLWCYGFNLVEVQRLEMLVGSEDFQDVDSLRREV